MSDLKNIHSLLSIESEEEDIEDEEFEDSDDFSEDEVNSDARQILMHSLDAQFNLLQALETSEKKILEAIPEKIGFWRPKTPLWRKYSEEILRGCVLGVEAIRLKLLCQLADLNIELINPGEGAPFDPTMHRAIERVKGKESKCIAKVIRYGYKKSHTLLRFADVSIYE